MIPLLLALGCSSEPAPTIPMGLPVCDPWKDRLTLGSERVVSCGERSIAFRLEGKVAQAQDAHFGKMLEDQGYTVERDVSRSLQIARVYAKDGERLALSITQTRDDTTVSLHVLE